MSFNKIFHVSGSLPLHVHVAATKAEHFLQTQLGVILGESSFTHTDHTPEQVFNHIASNVHMFDQNKPDEIITPRVLVEPWKPMNPWSSAIATTFKNKPGVVFMNVRKVHLRAEFEVVNTLVHEFCHTPCGYGHGSNSPKGKQRSVPYWLGGRAGDFFGGWVK